MKEGLLLFAQPGGKEEPGQGGGAADSPKSIFRGLRLQAAPQTEAWPISIAWLRSKAGMCLAGASVLAFWLLVRLALRIRMRGLR